MSKERSREEKELYIAKTFDVNAGELHEAKLSDIRLTQLFDAASEHEPSAVGIIGSILGGAAVVVAEVGALLAGGSGVGIASDAASRVKSSDDGKKKMKREIEAEIKNRRVSQIETAKKLLPPPIIP